MTADLTSRKIPYPQFTIVGPYNPSPVLVCFCRQAASEAATVRAGLGSFRNVSQLHWGATGATSAQESHGSSPADKHLTRGGDFAGQSATEPMDDDGDYSNRTLADENVRRSPDHSLPTPEFQGRSFVAGARKGRGQDHHLHGGGGQVRL